MPDTNQKSNRSTTQTSGNTASATNSLSSSRGTGSKRTGQESRSQGKSRYAQGHRGKRSAKPVVKSAPVKEYLSKCCGLPARKPVAGERSGGINPETKKASKVIKGLGHWRCSGCGKSAKVSPRKPQPTVSEEGNLGMGTGTIPQEVPSVSEDTPKDGV